MRAVDSIVPEFVMLAAPDVCTPKLGERNHSRIFGDIGGIGVDGGTCCAG